MTPEEIVGLIGNIANRPDLKEVQHKQIREIKELILLEREACAKIADNLYLGFHSPHEYKDNVAEAIRLRTQNCTQAKRGGK